MKQILALILLTSLPIYSMQTITTSGELSVEIPDMELTPQLEQVICERLMRHYFQENHSITPHIEPFLRQRIRNMYEVRLDTDLFESDGLAGKKDLHELILAATTEALKKESEKREAMCNKHTSAAIAAITGCLSTAVTAAVALFISYNSNKPEC